MIFYLVPPHYLILLKEGSITLEPRLFPFIGIEKNNKIIREIATPTTKHANPKAHGFGINKVLMVVSKAATPAAIIEDVNANI